MITINTLLRACQAERQRQEWIQRVNWSGWLLPSRSGLKQYMPAAVELMQLAAREFLSNTDLINLVGKNKKLAAKARKKLMAVVPDDEPSSTGLRCGSA